jgi:hypothetical protein
MLAAADSPPRSGLYPTSLWDKKEIVRDERVLPLPQDLPAGDYQLAVGMYRLETMQRLPILDAAGNETVDDEILLSLRTP